MKNPSRKLLEEVLPKSFLIIPQVIRIHSGEWAVFITPPQERNDDIDIIAGLKSPPKMNLIVDYHHRKANTDGSTTHYSDPDLRKAADSEADSVLPGPVGTNYSDIILRIPESESDPQQSSYLPAPSRFSITIWQMKFTIYLLIKVVLRSHPSSPQNNQIGSYRNVSQNLEANWY